MPLQASYNTIIYFCSDFSIILFVFGRNVPEERAFVGVNLLTVSTRVLDTLMHRLYMSFQVVSVGKLLVTNVTRVLGTLVN